VKVNTRAQIQTTRTSAGILLLLSALVSGCLHPNLTETTAPLVDDTNLLSGVAVFGESTTPLINTTDHLLAPHPQMPLFIETAIGNQSRAISRMRSVLSGLANNGYFVDNYAADATQTAADTFASKRGNCLSYTAMFVTLSRLAGLEVSFQIVDVPPVWTAGSDYLVRSTHINAVVHGVLLNGSQRDDLVVDFNRVSDTSMYPAKRISDRYAESLFLANLGVQQLRANNNLEGFRYLTAGIELAPTNPDLWSNLAAFYATQGAPKQAQAAYFKALKLQPRSRSIHSGLARAYESLQMPELAQQHQSLAREYQAKNPYYHFSLAQRALRKEDYAQALTSINRALELRRVDGSFHYLKAFTLAYMGDRNGAQQSLTKAQRLGADPYLQRRYPLPSDNAQT